MKSLSKMVTPLIIALTIVFAALITLGCETVPPTQDSETPGEVLIAQDSEGKETATSSGTSSVSEEAPLASVASTTTATPRPSLSPTSAPPPPASPTSLPTPTNSPTPSPIPTSTPTPVVQIEISELNIRTCPATNCSALGSGARSGVYNVAGAPVKGGQGYTWIPIEYQHEDSSERIAWVALVSGHFKQMGDWRGLERIEPPPTPPHTSTPIPTSAPPQKGQDFCVDPGTPRMKKAYEYPGWLPADYFDYNLDEYHEYTETIHCTSVIVAIHKDWDTIPNFKGGPVPEYEEFSKFVFETFNYYWQVFQGYPYDRYIVKVLSPDDDQQSISATAIGFIIVTNPELNPMAWFTTCDLPCVSGYKQFVTHEMFHAWNGNIIVEVGAHVSYIRPEYWFHEGGTQYYGFWGTPNELELYQRRINHAWQYYSQRIGTQYDIPIVEMSKMWVTTGDRQYLQMYYDKGASLFYLIDQEMNATGMNLDYLMRHMYLEFGLTERRYTTVDVLQALNTVTNNDWTEFFDKYIYDNEPLPLNGNFDYLWH